MSEDEDKGAAQVPSLEGLRDRHYRLYRLAFNAISLIGYSGSMSARSDIIISYRLSVTTR